MWDKLENNKYWWSVCEKKSADCPDWKIFGRMSFVMLNEYAYKNGKIGLFANTGGVIGTPNAMANMLGCVFSGDGGTMSRDHDGCGC